MQVRYPAGHGLSFWLPNAALALAAVFAILFASSEWGIGMTADSTVYVGSARMLLATGSLIDLDPQGHVVPLVHSAPLLPATLAGVSAISGIDPREVARVLCALCFGVSVGLVGWIARRWLGSTMLALTAALLLLVATPMIDIHDLAMSEPLFLVLAFGAMALLAGHLESSRWTPLVLAAILSALAVLTRYAGVALLGAEGLILLLLPRHKPLVFRIRALALFGILSCGPLAGWLIRNRWEAGHSTTAQASLRHLSGSFQALLGALPTYSSWLFPGSVPLFLRIAAMFLLVSTVAVGLWMGRGPAKENSPLAAILLSFMVCHLAMTGAVITLLYSDIPLDDRNLLPTLPAAILLLLWAIQQAADSPRHRLLVWVPAWLLVFAFLTANAPRSATHLWKAAKDGRGYASRDWQNSAVIQNLKRLPRNIPVYTSLPSAVRFLTGLPARSLPLSYDPRAALSNPNYLAELDAMRVEARATGIAVAFLGGLNLARFASAGELQKRLELVPVAQESSSALFWSPSLTTQFAAREFRTRPR